MWWLFAFLSAASQVSRNIVLKHVGQKLDQYVDVFLLCVFILPFAFFISLFHGIPAVPPIYWFYAGLAGFFTASSNIFLAKAFRRSDISLSVALWKANVLVLLLLEIIFFNVNITWMGMLGVVITVVGVYLLNISKAHVSVWKPFTLLFEDTGMRYALFAAFLLAPALLFFKITIHFSDPYFPAFTNFAFAALCILPMVWKVLFSKYKSIAVHWKSFVAMGLFACLSTVFTSIGFQQSFVTYVEAVKQSEILLALFAGIIFFKEHQRVKDIWLGCCVIILGICLVIFSR